MKIYQKCDKQKTQKFSGHPVYEIIMWVQKKSRINTCTKCGRFSRDITRILGRFHDAAVMYFNNFAIYGV